jgi:hypothetical protein
MKKECTNEEGYKIVADKSFEALQECGQELIQLKEQNEQYRDALVWYSKFADQPVQWRALEALRGKNPKEEE